MGMGENQLDQVESVVAVQWTVLARNPFSDQQICTLSALL